MCDVQGSKRKRWGVDGYVGHAIDAWRLHGQKRWGEAEASYFKALEGALPDKDRGNVFAGLALLYHETGENPKAMTYYLRAIELKNAQAVDCLYILRNNGDIQKKRDELFA